MDAKRLPKDVKKRRFFRIGRKTEKCKENILFTTLQPHRPHQKITIFGHFAGPKMTSKPRGDRMGPKCRQRAPQKPPEGVQRPKLIPTGCQMGSQGPPKMSPKMTFWGSWGAGARERVSRGSPEGFRIQFRGLHVGNATSGCISLCIFDKSNMESRSHPALL